MKANEMKENDIKNLFAGLQIEEPVANFEERIIAKSFAKRGVFQQRYAAMAAMFLFVMSFSIMNFTTQQNADEYANLVDDTAVISEDDIYGDLILAENI